MNTKASLRNQRRARIKARIRGTQERPRAVVYRTNKYITVQIIDDTTQTVLCSYSDMNDKAGMAGVTKTERAARVGKELAKRAQEKGIAEIAFDRAGFKYHGRVKAVADALREGGLKF